MNDEAKHDSDDGLTKATCSGLHAPDFKEGDCGTRDCHLDAGVAEIVYALYAAGVATSSSCAGGGPEAGHGLLERTVRFGWNDEDAGAAAVRIAAQLGMPVFQIRKSYGCDNVTGRIDAGFVWEMLFDRWTEWARPSGG